MATFLCLGLLCLAGCGGGGSGTAATSGLGSTTAGPSGFSSRLNALCGQWNAAASKLESNKQQASLIRRYVPRFRALVPPAALQSVYSRFIGLLVNEAGHLERNDTVGAEHVVEQLKPLAPKLGAPSCEK